MKTILVITFLLILIPLQACAHPPFYSAKEIKATIVDAETGEPLEGAIIVAQWILYQEILGLGHYAKRLEVLEAVTDKKGAFVIPAWGPKPRPPFTYLTYFDPRLVIFKSGYNPLELLNAPFEEFSRMYPNFRTLPTKTLFEFIVTHNLVSEASIRTSIWDGTAIQLEKFKGNEEKWAKQLSYVQNSIDWLGNPYWKKFPRMILAIEQERRRLRPEVRWWVSDMESVAGSPEKVRKFFEDFKP